MILLDTHVWVWWAVDGPKLSKAAKRVLAKTEQKAIADITLWEVAMLCAKGRLRLDRPVGEWLDQAVEETAVEIVPISAAVATRSTALGAVFHGDPADQLIAATALVQGLALVTADERLRQFLGIETVW